MNRIKLELVTFKNQNFFSLESEGVETDSFSMLGRSSQSAWQGQETPGCEDGRVDSGTDRKSVPEQLASYTSRKFIL